MKIFKDKDQTIEVSVLDLGIVEAGDSKEYTFWLYNDTTAYLREVECFVEHNEVKILEYPEELSAYAIGEIRIKWSPSVTLKEGLKAPLKITAKEQWG